MHTCTHAHMHTRTHAHMHMHTCTHAHMHTCTDAHMHTCTCTHTRTHAHMHTCAGGERGSDAQEDAAGALYALADHGSNRLVITEAGGIAPLVALLGSVNVRARHHAEGTLVRLSIESGNRVLIIKQLVSMLDQGGGCVCMCMYASSSSSPC